MVWKEAGLMFIVVISRLKEKVMLLMRLILILCILLLLSVQLYNVIRKGDTPPLRGLSFRSEECPQRMKGDTPPLWGGIGKGAYLLFVGADDPVRPELRQRLLWGNKERGHSTSSLGSSF